jgi:peptidoglycan/LPS O-acetylase OafA/YrhL
MLQDFGYGKPGTWFPAFGGNLPLWSLAYEWWFYMLFYPIWRYVPDHQQQQTATAISLAGLIGYVWHPNQPCLYLAYFILWWTGAEFGRQYLAEGRITFRHQRSSLLVLGAFVCLVALLLFSRHNWSGDLQFGVYPILQFRHFAACLAIALGALLWQRLNWRGFDGIFGIFIWVAPISYGLYVLHSPILNGLLSKSIPTPWSFPILIMAVFAAAWFAEFPFQKFCKRLTDNLFPKRTIQVPATPGEPLTYRPTSAETFRTPEGGPFLPKPSNTDE